MKKLAYAIAILFFNSFIASAQLSNQIIIKIKSGKASLGKSISKQPLVGNILIDSISVRHKVLQVKQQSSGRKNKQMVYVITFPQDANIKQVIEEYYQSGEVEYAEPNGVGSGGGVKATAPDDQFYSRQWYTKNDGSFTLSTATIGADIQMEEAWKIEQGDSNVIVAIIDSGNKLDHPEYEGRNWINYLEIPNNGIDDDDNGYIDDTMGWDFANDDNNPTDDHGHGTNVTGIIGVNANNGIGYAGIDWNCKLMTLKGLSSSNFGYYSWWADAIYYAVDNGAKVINMSVGGSDVSATLQDAINYALTNNVVVVACMMNTNSNAIYYPASYPGVIAVGATNPNDKRASPFFWSPTSGSNYGNHISVVAPGNYIYGLNYQSNTNFNSYWGGTSQATPIVAGLAALLLAQNPNRTPAQIKSIIETSADDQVGDPTEDTQGWDQYYGYGRINALKALSNATTKVSSLQFSQQQLLVYPNPSQHTFTVVIPKNTKFIQVLNALGQSISSQQILGQETIQFNQSQNGVYVVQASNGNKIISQKVVIIGSN